MRKLCFGVLALLVCTAAAYGQEVVAEEDVEETLVERQREAEEKVFEEDERERLGELPLKERFGESWTRRSESFVFGKGQLIPRDRAVAELVTMGGTAQLDGYAREVVTIFGRTRIGEKAIVSGNVVTVFGATVIEEGAVVEGDAVSVFGPTVDPGRGVQGRTVAITGPFSLLITAVAGHTVLTMLLLKTTSVVVALLLSYLVVGLMPNGIVRIGDQIARNPFISGCVGAGALVASPLIFIILAVTCVGLLLVPLALVIGIIVGGVGVYQVVGNKVRSRLGGNSYRPFLDVTVGVLLVWLIMLVPFVGPIAKLAVWMVGLGALLLTKFGTREGVVIASKVTAGEPAGEPE